MIKKRIWAGHRGQGLGLAAVLMAVPMISSSALHATSGPGRQAAAIPRLAPSFDPSPEPMVSVTPSSVAEPPVPSSRTDRRRLQAPGVASREEAVGLLTIPRLGLRNVSIYDRGLDRARKMMIAPGVSVTHFTGSSPLGGPSNAVLYGHDDIEGGVFGGLSQLRDGDSITVSLPGGILIEHRVQGAPSIVVPGSVGILSPTSTPRLTLFSCYPLWVDNKRVVVIAVPVAR